jgi:hypothetical protein
MRGRVFLLYMLLTLASVVFLGSESLGTRDHILLSQICDFLFRRLLRLAGSRWRYSTPPLYFFVLPNTSCNHFARTTQKTASIVKEAYFLVRYLAVDVLLHQYASRECVYYYYYYLFNCRWVFTMWQRYNNKTNRQYNTHQ